MTSAHLAISSFSSVAYASGVLPFGVEPSFPLILHNLVHPVPLLSLRARQRSGSVVTAST
jgi:hypothetical protein